MSAEQAAWIGAAASLIVWGAVWLGHCLLCNCSNSRRCRAARTVRPIADKEVQHDGK
jgi:hypothetical protein